MKKLSNIKAELKNSVVYKKSVYSIFYILNSSISYEGCNVMKYIF